MFRFAISEDTQRGRVKRVTSFSPTLYLSSCGSCQNPHSQWPTRPDYFFFTKSVKAFLETLQFFLRRQSYSPINTYVSMKHLPKNPPSTNPRIGKEQSEKTVIPPQKTRAIPAKARNQKLGLCSPCSTSPYRFLPPGAERDTA